MHLFFKMTVYSNPFCRHVIIPNFSQGLVYISKKTLILQYSLMAINNHLNKERKTKGKRE